MKIKSDRFDSLQRARQEYDAETERLTQKRQELGEQYKAKIRSQAADVEKAVSDAIKSTSLDLTIHADPYGKYLDSKGWSVKVKANENKKFSEDVALIWSWEASVNDEGQVVKDSGSWSGLNVTTPAQIADLKESIRVIEILNNLNWDYILSYPKARYTEYSDDALNKQYNERKSNRPDFESQMIEAQLEDLVGSNTAVQLIGYDAYRGRAGILLTGLTDKFLKGYIFPWNDRYLSSTADEIRQYTYNPAKVSKSKLVVSGDGSIATADLA